MTHHHFVKGLTSLGYRAIYDKTIFCDADNDYCVISVMTTDTQVPEKAISAYQSHDGKARFIATGHGLPQTSAVELMLEGEWQSTKYGFQLVVEHWEEILPHTIAGVKSYLASGLIKGIGSKTADAIVDMFGADTLDILDRYPERLLEVKGIANNTLEHIKASYLENRSLRYLAAFLAPFKVTAKTAQKIHQAFGAGSMNVIMKQPFELLKISGFGFKRVDEIARKTTCNTNDPLRIKGALLFILDESRSKGGHLFLTTEDICTEALKLLNDGLPVTAHRVQMQEVAAILIETVKRGELVADSKVIYLPGCYTAEQVVAGCIAKAVVESGCGIDISKELANTKQKLGITLSARQEQAVSMAFQHNLSIVTGSPGTGKTTILRAVIDVFQQIHGDDAKILLTAPTGRASRRMAESTGFQNAKTLHSALGLVTSDEETSYLNSGALIDTDLIIVDEVSMVDMQLAFELFMRIKRGTKVLFVGDADQLPSVGAGNVFRELISCGLLPVTVLTDIFRQSKDSLIAYNAKFINENNTGLIYGDDFVFLNCGSQDETAETIRDVYLQEIKLVGLDDVQIMSPYRSDGSASAEKLNEVIRARVNPASRYALEIRSGARIFRQGDRVMQIKNKNGISNGDVGYIRMILNMSSGDPVVTIEFSEGRTVEYDASGLGIIEHAYAMTVHKAMGSEYDTVIIPMLTAHNILLYRNLIYTAITRAKQRVILVGQKKALYTAIRRSRIDKRNTLLGKRIAHQLEILACHDAIA